MTYELHPIGIVNTPFDRLDGMPIQPVGAKEIIGTIVLEKKYAQGLSDLDGFSHILVLFWLHQSKGYDLMVTPFLDDQKRGVFSTRAPRRPNPIGLSVVRLIKIEKNILTIQGADMLNQTPVVDIKPYIPVFDMDNPKEHNLVKTGWLEKAQQRAKHQKSDHRFIKNGQANDT